MVLTVPVSVWVLTQIGRPGCGRTVLAPQQVIYTSPDGMTIHGQLFLPADLKPGEKRPAMVFVHGGSRRQMLLGWHYYMAYYNNACAMNQYLANQGYIVPAINYGAALAMD